jgi:hypothetical protein
MAKTKEEIEAEKRAAIKRTVRDVAKEGVAGATKTVGDVALEGVKTASRMKSGAEQYVGGQLRKGAGALVDKASEMNPLDAMGAAAKVANQASNPIGAIANAIGDIEVGGGGGGESETEEVRPSSEEGQASFTKEMQSAQSFLDAAKQRREGKSELDTQAQGVMDLLASRRLDADLQGKSTELAGGVAQKDFSFSSAADDVIGAADNGKFTPSPIEGAAEFDKEFGELDKSLGRPEEGETADQYEERLKERSAARKELQSQRPYDSVLAGTFKNEGQSDLPTITSPKVKESSRAVADKPAAGQAPPTIQDPKALLKGRQEFGSYLEGQLSKSGGNYTFNKDDQAKAKELGIGRKEMDNFTKKLFGRDEEEEPRRRRSLGQIGGNKFGA